MRYLFSVLSLILHLLFMASFLTGCASTIARMSVDGMKPIMQDMREATNRNPDVALIHDAMPAMLTQMDGFIQVSPENRYLLVSAAEANLGYAFLFVEDRDRQRAQQLYAKAREYALRNLETNETFRQAFEQDELQVFTDALKTIHKRDIAALYMATNSWLQLINLSRTEKADTLKDLPKVKAMMDRLLVLDETFYYGGAHVLMGVYTISRSDVSGIQPDEAQTHFQKAFTISASKYLLWHYLYARYYAVQTKDRDLFVTTLNRIIATPVDILPEQAFVNAAVKLKAEKLLQDVDKYFQR